MHGKLVNSLFWLIPTFHRHKLRAHGQEIDLQNVSEGLLGHRMDVFHHQVAVGESCENLIFDDSFGKCIMIDSVIANDDDISVSFGLSRESLRKTLTYPGCSAYEKCN